MTVLMLIISCTFLVLFGGTCSWFSQAMVLILARHSQAQVISMAGPDEPNMPPKCEYYSLLRSRYSVLGLSRNDPPH